MRALVTLETKIAMVSLRKNNQNPASRGSLSSYRVWISSIAEYLNIKILIYLLALDVVLIVFHITTGIFMEKIPSVLNIAQDRSLAEWFGYAKLACASLLLWLAYRASRIPVLLSFTVIFAAMVADDSMELHENLGGWASSAFDLIGVTGQRGQDVGELLVWGAMAIILLPILAFGVVKTLPQDRLIGFGLAICAAILTFFAIGVDAVHGPACSFLSVPYCFQLFDLIEDGGEMITQSFILAHVLTVFQNNAVSTPPKAGLLRTILR